MINVAGAGYMMGAVAPLMKETNRKESILYVLVMFLRDREFGSVPLHQGFESAKRLYV